MLIIVDHVFGDSELHHELIDIVFSIKFLQNESLVTILGRVFYMDISLVYCIRVSVVNVDYASQMVPCKSCNSYYKHNLKGSRNSAAPVFYPGQQHFPCNRNCYEPVYQKLRAHRYPHWPAELLELYLADCALPHVLFPPLYIFLYVTYLSFEDLQR